jgi:NADH-quinone oxidoreductase subunit K
MTILSINSYLFISFFLFIAGIAVVLIRKNLIGILIGIELILNASVINFLSYCKYRGYDLNGHVFALFIIVVAAAEAAIALGIAIRFFQLRESVHIDDATDLRY